MKEYIVQAIAQETIDSFNAHNAPELVRCKDCKRRYEYRTGSCPYFTVYGSTAPENWFCADGKRKDDDV